MHIYWQCLLLFLNLYVQKPSLKEVLGDSVFTIIEPQDEKVIGNILFLNGWNMKTEEICLQSTLCSLANKNGYRLIIPHMGKSVYASQYFKETRNDYRKLKTIQWLCDTLLLELKTKGISLENNGNNHIIGLSTGARGAVLVATKQVDVYKSIVLLSGDYDQSIDTTDLLMINTYGRFYQNPERWKSVDNPLFASSNLNCNVFIGHGQKDKVVKAKHAYLLEKKLQTSPIMKSKKIETYFPDSAGHDWKFWREGIERGMEFIKN
jgi:S-formylglutathione hydrolase FrmB